MRLFRTKLTCIVTITFLVMMVVGCAKKTEDNSNVLEIRESIPEFDLNSVKSPQPSVYKHQLQNGLTVLIAEKPGVSVASVQVWYKVGSIHERKGIKGIAHLFEHMMFRGSKNFDKGEHQAKITQVGGNSNAYTSDERTVYHQVVPATYLEMVLEMEADRMYQLKLNQTILDTEREVVKEEFHWRYENNAWNNLYRKAKSHFFPNHPYQWGAIGLYADIESFSLQDIQEFYDHYYAPNNAVLVITGDVKHEATLSMVKNLFGVIPSKTIPESPDLKLNPKEISSFYESNANYIVPVTLLSYYMPPSNHPDTAPLEILFQILTHGKNSRLRKKLTRDNDLVTGFSPFYGQQEGVGMMAFVSFHLPHFSEKTKAVIENELKIISEEGIKRHELVIAKNQILSEIVFSRYQATSIASRLGYFETTRDDYRQYDEEIKRLTRVTNEDIVRVSRKYLGLENQKEIYFTANNSKFYIWWYGLFRSIIS